MSHSFLIVDDSPLDREMCELLLKESQKECVVHVAKNCAEALMFAAAHRDIDCILLDWNLPDGKGVDIIQQIHAKTPNSSIIMMTVQDDVAIAKKALQLGADDYLIKGEYSSAMLGRSIEYAIERRRTKLRERALSVALEAEKRLNDIQKKFICLVAHEFRTPLGIISGAVQLLQAKQAKMEQARQVEDPLSARQYTKIQTAISRLTGLMDNVLLLHNLEEGLVLGMPTHFDMLSLLRKIIDQLDGTSDTRSNISIESEIPYIKVQGNVQLCEYCLYNVIGNALKYSPEGAEVKLYLSVSDAYVQVRIVDQGVGIDSQTLEKIGQRFVRGEDTLDKAGVGLGLFLAFQFAHHNGGALYLCSEKGEGTTAVVKWPLCAVSSMGAARLPQGTGEGRLGLASLLQA